MYDDYVNKFISVNSNRLLPMYIRITIRIINCLFNLVRVYTDGSTIFIINLPRNDKLSNLVF